MVETQNANEWFIPQLIGDLVESGNVSSMGNVIALTYHQGLVVSSLSIT